MRKKKSNKDKKSKFDEIAILQPSEKDIKNAFDKLLYNIDKSQEELKEATEKFLKENSNKTK